MRIVCPYVTVGTPGVERGLHPLCEQALARYAPGTDMIDLGNRPDAYHELLCELWAADEAFLIVEHDVEIHERVIPELEACGEAWCAFPYAIGYPPLPIDSSLGCTRFSAEAIRLVPDLMSMLPVRDWRRQDCEINPRLRTAGLEPHVHLPAVKHHHAYPAPGGERCACGEEH